MTNQRLIYSKKEGLFYHVFWRGIEEIPLEQIEEAYTHTIEGVVQSSSAMLKMKDGQTRELKVNVGGEGTLGSFLAVDGPTYNAVQTKTLSDKWANAINQQLRQKAENRTEMLEERIKELEKKLKEEK